MDSKSGRAESSREQELFANNCRSIPCHVHEPAALRKYLEHINIAADRFP